MRLLLDTHAFLWWQFGHASLSLPAREAISNMGNEVFVSAASAWEITTKHRNGRLPHAGPILPDIEGAVRSQGFYPLAVNMAHAQLAGAMPGDHRDPFDRMLIAQALLESLALVSNEKPFDAFGVTRLW